MKGYTIQNSIELLEKKAGSGSGGASTAAEVSFDNTGSGLDATNVQTAISEVNSNVDEISGRFDYSTDEKVIGKFVNGKPLYQKTIYAASPTKAASIQHGIENVEHIFIHDVDAKQNASASSTTRCGNYYLSTNDFFGAICSTGTVFVDWGSSAAINDLYVTLRYTKSTDTIPATRSTRKKSSK